MLLQLILRSSNDVPLKQPFISLRSLHQWSKTKIFWFWWDFPDFHVSYYSIQNLAYIGINCWPNISWIPCMFQLPTTRYIHTLLSHFYPNALSIPLFKVRYTLFISSDHIPISLFWMDVCFGSQVLQQTNHKSINSRNKMLSEYELTNEQMIMNL